MIYFQYDYHFHYNYMLLLILSFCVHASKEGDCGDEISDPSHLSDVSAYIIEQLKYVVRLNDDISENKLVMCNERVFNIGKNCKVTNM